ncbi:MAG: RHS repeat-associated core domain-containing protein [Pseudomonas sp.]
MGNFVGLTYKYAPYGHLGVQCSVGFIGFNGQSFQPWVGGYALGNGYRIYSPSLMRFLSPDASSPFLDGGVNAYAYCNGDPVNKVDPSGHGQVFGRPSKSTPRRATGTAGQATSGNRGTAPLGPEHLPLQQEVARIAPGNEMIEAGVAPSVVTFARISGVPLQGNFILHNTVPAQIILTNLTELVSRGERYVVAYHSGDSYYFTKSRNGFNIRNKQQWDQKMASEPNPRPDHGVRQ